MYLPLDNFLQVYDRSLIGLCTRSTLWISIRFMLCLYGFESAQNADLPCILKNLPTKSMSFFFQKRFFNANILNYIHKKNIPQLGYVEITFTTVVSEETS